MHTHRPKHRAHRFLYIPWLDQLGTSRAGCPAGLRMSKICTDLCDIAMCPRHKAVNYAKHMARHATDSIR